MLVDFCYAGRLQAGLATDELLTVLGLAHQYHMQHLMDIIVARLAGLVALTDDIFAIYAAALKLELWDLVKTVRLWSLRVGPGCQVTDMTLSFFEQSSPFAPRLDLDGHHRWRTRRATPRRRRTGGGS